VTNRWDTTVRSSPRGQLLYVRPQSRRVRTNPRPADIPLTYNAPKTCSPGWSHTTSAIVIVPYEVTPTPIATLPPSTEEGLGQNFLIAASEIPSTSLTSLSSAYRPYYSNLCQVPSQASYYGSSPTFAAGGGSDDGLDGCVSMELLFGGSPVGGGYDCDDGMHWVCETPLDLEYPLTNLLDLGLELSRYVASPGDLRVSPATCS
jgi:hypothetical protein